MRSLPSPHWRVVVVHDPPVEGTFPLRPQRQAGCPPVSRRLFRQSLGFALRHQGVVVHTRR